MKKALLIIDIQNDYFPGGTHVLADSETAGTHASKLLNTARNRNLEIIHIKHIAVNEGADFFLPDTYGAEIHHCVKPLDGEKVIIKNYPNSFRETELLKYLHEKDVTELVICGMMTDVCVDATVRAAMDLGFNTTVIGDACAARDRELYGETVSAGNIQKAYLAGMTALGGLYADVIKTEEF
ncbi:nicotinamidase-related amidase [Chryseobacterium sp. H1D6B]|uniref:cysteine hydrolase family protein n=1 Tax=Chryseobacterium sp. H1D6B TaxID=2940588 RepID=UPI0015CA0ED9|nr:cysteine hydrolase family protein [Chryseobacterium sp. H1D6B]MDH6253660.1 nicotinamidase-related amidase [Chryseobacterium sp. H1D6B]